MHFSKLVQLPYDLKPIGSVEGLPKASRSNHLYLNVEQDAPHQNHLQLRSVNASCSIPEQQRPQARCHGDNQAKTRRERRR